MLQPSDAALIARERFVGLAVFIMTAVGPWVVLAWLLRRTRRHPALVVGLALPPAAAITGAGLFFTMCWYPGPPGRGAKSDVARRRAELVLVALAQYRRELGLYPETLVLLAPRLLSDTALPAFERAVGYPLDYRPSPDRRGFELRFRYTGPGMNECAWQDSSRTWHCEGYF